MTHRFREQARSHNGPGQGHNLQRNPNPCGSGLAREGVGKFNLIIACHTAFASRLAPTGNAGEQKASTHLNFSANLPPKF